MRRDGFPLHDDLDLRAAVREDGALWVSLRVASAYPEISIAREGVMFRGGAVRLRYLVAEEETRFEGETAALPVLIWAEAAGVVPFGAGVGRVRQVDLGVEVE